MNTNYRKIYEYHYGPVPKDSNGRSYEIHHIDGNHNNNTIDNLKLVTIQEHYDIHFSQSDWSACLIMAERMNLSPAEKSQLAIKSNQQRILDGTHNFLDSEWQRENQHRRVENRNHPWADSERARKRALDRIAEGTHNLTRRPDGTSQSKDRVLNGTHNLLGGEVTRNQIANGKHAAKIQVQCPHCGKVGGKTGMMTRHFDNCRSINPQL